jgi:hypothetical protein
LVAEPIPLAPPVGFSRRLRAARSRRWDAPEADFATLYGATTAVGAFIETLPYYRRSDDFLARLHRETSEDEPDASLDLDLATGEIKADYFKRILGRASLPSDLRFVDVDHARTHAQLNRELPELLAQHGLQEFDRGVVMNADRRITRAIAGHLHAIAGPDVVGLRYESRRHRGIECWAVWEQASAQLADVDLDPLTPDLRDLQEAAATLGLTFPADVQPPDN